MRRISELSAFQITEVRVIKRADAESWQSIMLMCKEGFIEVTAFGEDEAAPEVVLDGERP